MNKAWKFYLSLAKTSHANEALVIINWHNARDNGTLNSNLATIIDKFEENISVVEKLSDNKISSSINFSLQIGKVTLVSLQGSKAITLNDVGMCL